MNIASAADVSSRGTETATFNYLDQITAVIEGKLDLGDLYIADTTKTMAGDYPGVYKLKKVKRSKNE